MQETYEEPSGSFIVDVDQDGTPYTTQGRDPGALVRLGDNDGQLTLFVEARTALGQKVLSRLPRPTPANGIVPLIANNERLVFFLGARPALGQNVVSRQQRPTTRQSTPENTPFSIQEQIRSAVVLSQRPNLVERVHAEIARLLSGK